MATEFTVDIAELMPLIQREAQLRNIAPAEIISGFGSNAGQMKLAFQNVNDRETAKTRIVREMADRLSAAKTGKANTATITTRSYGESELGQVQSDVANLRSFHAQQLPLLEAVMGSFRQNNNAAEAAIDKASTAAQNRIDTEAQRGIAEQQNAGNILSQFGINMNDNQAMLITAEAQSQAAARKMMELKPAIDAARSVNPMQNVLGWIGAQLNLQKIMPEYQAAVTSRQQADDIVRGQQQKAAAQKSLQPALTMDKLLDEARARKNEEIAKAELQKMQLQQQNLGQQITLLHTAEAWARNDVSTSMGLLELTKSLRAETEKEGGTKEEREFLAKMQVLYAQLGRAKPTMMDTKLLSREQREMISEQFTDTGRFRSFGSGVAIMDELGSKVPSEIRSQVEIAWLANAKREGAEKFLTQDMQKLKPAEQVAAAMDKLGEDWIKKASERKYEKLSSTNPYRANLEVMATAKELENNETAKWVIEKAKAGKKINEEEMLQGLIARIAIDPKQLPALVEDTRKFMEIGYRHQFAALGLGKYGFTPQNPKTEKIEYPISGTILSFDPADPFAKSKLQMFGAKEVDLMNYAALEHLATTETAKYLRKMATIGAVKEGASIIADPFNLFNTR